MDDFTLEERKILFSFFDYPRGIRTVKGIAKQLKIDVETVKAFLVRCPLIIVGLGPSAGWYQFDQMVAVLRYPEIFGGNSEEVAKALVKSVKE